MQELRRVAVDGVTDSELTKATNMMLVDFWRGLATINGKARALGNHAVFLDAYEALFDLPAAVEAIEAGGLQQVAADVFRVNNMTLGVLRPPANRSDQ